MLTTDALETAHKLHFRTNFQGIPVSVENRKGSYRRGVDPDGKPWEIKMNYHYGRIPRTRGADGDAVDAYIGPDKTSDKVYIIEQVEPDTGKFDELKCMLGFRTKAEAIRGYKSQYNRPGFYGGCQTMTIQEFKDWLRDQTPKKVERRNLEERVVKGQRVLEDNMKIVQQDKESKFDKLVKKLMKENGYSEDRARRIAYTIGVKKYGKAGMAAKSAAGRKKDAIPENETEFITDEDIEEVTSMEDEYLGWEKLVKKLRSEGKSKESAENIAASIGRKKYGAAGMAKKAAAGRDSDITETLQSEGTHTGTDYSLFSPKEMALGILVEKEHADDVADRLEIAADHLVEDPAYYTGNKHFIAELRKEYGAGLKSAYQGALKLVRKMVPLKDSPSVNTVIMEALITPIIKKLMKTLGFKRLIWRGSGWVVPISLDEYGVYLRMIPQLKVYDRMLQNLGYEISLAPGWFKIVPVDNGKTQ